MSIDIPDELKPIFDQYKGTGTFTVGAVMEYIHRYNTIKQAKEKDVLEWIMHAIELSRQKGLFDDDTRHDYINENAEYWIDVWKDARNNYVLFNRKYSKAFEDAGMLSIQKEHAAECTSNGAGQAAIIFDLVELKHGIYIEQEQEGQCPILPGHS